MNDLLGAMCLYSGIALSLWGLYAALRDMRKME